MLQKLCFALFGVVVNSIVVLAASSETTSFSTDAVVASSPKKLHILIYETDSTSDSPAFHLLDQATGLGENVQAQIFGGGTKFEGYGSKYSAVYPLLEAMDPDSLVVLSDGRDVLINQPAAAVAATTAITEFYSAYTQLTRNNPGAVVVSAEAQCCVSALTHVSPGDLFRLDGTRREFACASGKEDCLWNGDDMARPWEAFMTELALTRTESSEYDDVYLNAGLMAGTAKDLMQLIDATQISGSEDDQAVLTDYMYHNEDSIILDYGQTVFGNNRGGVMGDDSDGCVFLQPRQTVNERLKHEKTGTSPLFLHSPGGFTKCHDDMSAALGLDVVAQTARRRLGRGLTSCNYFSCRRKE